MGMEHHRGPRRRRVGVGDPDELVHVPIRLSHENRELITQLREPGVLAPKGCAQGDVLVIAIRELARRYRVR